MSSELVAPVRKALVLDTNTLVRAALGRRVLSLLESYAERGLTQVQAAEILGIDQPKVSALVRGSVTGFSIGRLFSFLSALGQDMEIAIRPAQRASLTGRISVITDRGLTLADLHARRQEILQLAARYGARNVRVFGSVARGESGPGSDVDFVVELEPQRTVLDLGELTLDLEELLGRAVDVVDIRRPSPTAEQILRETVPL